MSQKLYLTFESSLSDVCSVNSSFDRGVLRICYPGENRNKSFIAREDLVRCVNTLPYVPVVGNYIREEEDFGGHDVEVVTTSDGTLRLVNKTQPVGVVPSDAKIYFDTIVDSYGNEVEYLFTEVLLWKRQEAYKKIKEDGVISHSMEITVKSGETIDGIFHIYDFEFTALCLLGENVEPCFEDSALEVFTTSDFKAQFELMMEDFKKSFNLATTSTEDKTYLQDDTLTEGGEEDLEPKFTQEALDVEDAIDTQVNEEFEAESAETEPTSDAPESPEADEQPEEAETEVVEDEEAPEGEEAHDEDETEHPEDDPEAKDENEFTLSGSIEMALADTLRNMDRIIEGDYEYTRYWMVDYDADKSVVYFEDMAEDWHLFGCSYTMSGDKATVDLGTKKRMKWVIADFDEGTANVPEMSMFEAVSECAKERVSSEYEAKIAEFETELGELREFKHNADVAEATNVRNEIIAEFTDLVGIEEFSALCDNMLDYEAEDFRKECYALRGKNMSVLSSATFSAKTNLPKFPVESNGVRNIKYEDAPYGGVVEEYKERGLV